MLRNSFADKANYLVGVATNDVGVGANYCRASPFPLAIESAANKALETGGEVRGVTVTLLALLSV